MIAHIFVFSFLVFEKKKLRVCGAEVEWTLQKCCGGFEFTIKIIACHSLSPSFSPMKSIIFLSLAILSFSIHVDGQLVPDWPISQLRLDSSYRHQAVTSREDGTSVVDWGSGPDPLPSALPVVCWLFLCTCACTKPAGAGHRSWSPCHSHATHTIHSHISSTHSHICSTLALCSHP